MKKLGIREEKRGMDVRPDEGFDYNPGKAGLAAWKPDMEKYSAEEKRLLKMVLAG
jgi:hypothetical protein